MKLKLTYDEAHVLMHELKTFTFWNYVTRYEKDVTTAILKVLLVKIMKRLLDAKPKLMKPKKPIYISFELTHETVLALDFGFYCALCGSNTTHEYWHPELRPFSLIFCHGFYAKTHAKSNSYPIL